MRARISQLINIRFPEWSIPLAFLAALVFAFGLLIPTLGFYQDDWLFIYNHYALGPQGIWEFMYYDGTPFASYLNNLQFALLGYAPLHWHILSLLSRWLTVVIFWLVLRRLWPDHPRQVFWVSIVFALHPFFNLQPMAVTFSQVWITYFGLGLSFYLMVLSVQKPSYYWLYTFLSLLSGAFTLLSGEYFAGLEFVRPFILWFALAGRLPNFQERLSRSIICWGPYFIALGAYIYWRFFVYVVPIANRNQPTLIRDILSNPISGIWQIITNIIPDTVLIVLSSWYNLLEPKWLDLNVRINQFALILVFIAGWLAFYYLNRQKHDKTTSSHAGNWPLQALFFGFVIVVFGLIPPYVGGLYINAKNPLWHSRFGMASMLGASLMIISLLEILVASHRARIILLASFVGLSSGWHFRYTNDFRYAWEKQVNFYRQLTVRIPEITPNTALVAENEVLSLMGDYPTAYAINTLYARQNAEEAGRMRYWFYGITTNFSRDYEEFVQGMTLFTRHRSMMYRGNSHEVILFTFDPGLGQCLHVVRPQDNIARTLSSRLRSISVLSAVDRIQDGTDFSRFLRDQIGIEADANWCDTYQRADLAYQYRNWDEVIRLWKVAQQAGFSPNDSYEYLPFIEAHIIGNQPENALKISSLATRHPPSMRPTVCDLWARVIHENNVSNETLFAHENVKFDLACEQP